MQLPLSRPGPPAAHHAPRRGQLRRPERRDRAARRPRLLRLEALRGQARGRPAQDRASEGVLFGTAAIDGHPLVVAAMDFAFIGGSMGSAVGEGITRAAELALETRTPLLVIAASGGARMQEGCVSLMQMAKTSQAIARLHEEGILFVCLLTDPTYGGVTASFATLGDVLVSEPGSYVGFAGPKVIEQTIRQTLPDGFQTAEFLMEHGMLDLVEPRENLRPTLRKLLQLHALAAECRDASCERQGPAPELRRAGAGHRSRPAGAAPRLGRGPARPPRRPAEHARVHRLRLRRLPGAPRRPPLRRGPAIVGGIARLGELPAPGRRPSEGPHDAAR